MKSLAVIIAVLLMLVIGQMVESKPLKAAVSPAHLLDQADLWTTTEATPTASAIDAGHTYQINRFWEVYGPILGGIIVVMLLGVACIALVIARLFGGCVSAVCGCLCPCCK